MSDTTINSGTGLGNGDGSDNESASVPVAPVWQNTAFIGLVFMSLSDVYFPSIGVPIVPIFGAVLFIFASLMWTRSNNPAARLKRRNTVLTCISLIFFYVLSVLWGLLDFGSGGIKAAVGMGIGTIVLMLILYQEDNEDYRQTLLKFIGRLLVFHLTFWMIQFVVYIVSHNFIDFLLPITGEPTRHTIGAAGVEVRLDRCSGLYAEPSIYVTNIYFLVTLRLIRSKLKPTFVDYLALASMIASIALTGIALAAFVLFFVIVKSIRSYRSALTVLGIFVIVGIGVSAFGNTDLMTIIFIRVDAPTSDPSGKVRTVDALAKYQKLPESAQLFGIGVGNTEVLDHISNGLLDILINFGLIGSCILLGVFIYLVCMHHATTMFWVFFVGMMGGGPYSTILMWWVWFGGMIFAGIEARHELTQHEHNTAMLITDSGTTI